MRKLGIRLGLILSILVLLANKGYCQQEYYVWIDENGVTNYAERAPSGSQPTHVTGNQRFGHKARPQTKPPEKNLKETAASGDLMTRAIDPDEVIAEEKAKYQTELDAERRRNCELGKKNLARLETFARIRVLGEDGEYRFLSPEEMTEKKRESREAIIYHCR